MSPWLSDLFLRSQSDERLLALARTGQQRAFTAIVERYGRELQAYARRLDVERAEDLVQQAFLCAFTALQGGAEVRHLRGWLFQILRNVAARTFVSRARESELQEAEAVTESAQQAAERRMLALDALAAVAELPGRQHDALVQTALHGRSRTEVAHVMGLSEGAVRQLVHRARETLRTAVTAITPLPLARWLGDLQAGGAAGLPEISAGAGAASVAGVVVKVSALLATGAVATGVASIVIRHHSARPHLGATVSQRVSGGAMAGHLAGGGAGVLTAGATGADALASASPDKRHDSTHRDSGGEHSGQRRDGGGGSRSRDGGHTDGGSSTSSTSGTSGTSGSSGSSGSIDGGTSGGSSGGSSDGGTTQPSAVATSGGGTSGGGTSGSSDGGTTTTTTTTTTTSSSDGGSGTSGSSGDLTTTSVSSSGSDGGTTTTTSGGTTTTSGGPGPN